MATDFFQRQRHARIQTLRLRVLFALAMALSSVLVAVGVVLFLASVGFAGLFPGGRTGVLAAAFLHGNGGWRIAAGVMVFSLAFSAATAWSLREGGPALARSLRGRPLHPESNQPAERQLLNIVSEMSLASQVPEPEVWLLDREDSINAFAAGKTVEGAVIGVTSGALKELDRDELQAVVAHEFSHILNGDMALNTRLIAWLSGLFAIERFARALRRDKRDEPTTRTVLFWWLHLGFWFLHVCGYVGLFIGRMLQAAICRRRETLADASAVQFTRNPTALKSALLKIDAAHGTRRIGAGAAVGMAHMFFVADGDGVGGWLKRLQQSFLETHPPMMERVRALDGGMTELQYRAAVRNVRKQQLNAKQSAAAPVVMSGEKLQRAVERPMQREVQDLLCSRLNREQQQAVLSLQKQIPESAEGLQALFVAALLDSNTARARTQLLTLAAVLGAGVATRVVGALNQLNAMTELARLPLLSSLLPELAALPDRDRLRIVKVTRAFAEKITPLDTLRFATSRLLLRTLVHEEKKPSAARPDSATVTIDAHAAPLGLLCSLLAQCTFASSARAYAAGMNGLVPPLYQPPFIDQPIEAEAVDSALAELASLPYLKRAATGAALVRVIGANGSMSAAEFNLLRVISTSLDIFASVPASVGLERSAPQADAALRRQGGPRD